MGSAEIVSGTALGVGASASTIGFRPIATMPKGAPKKYRLRWERLARLAAHRSFAAIELHCLDCVCWERAEARDCALSTCSLWALNRRIFAREPAQPEAEEAS